MARITREMVEACAQEMAARDWLPQNWDTKKEKCECCGESTFGTTDGGAEIRTNIRHFLKAALRAQESE